MEHSNALIKAAIKALPETNNTDIAWTDVEF